MNFPYDGVAAIFSATLSISLFMFWSYSMYTNTWSDTNSTFVEMYKFYISVIIMKWTFCFYVVDFFFLVMFFGLNANFCDSFLLVSISLDHFSLPFDFQSFQFLKVFCISLSLYRSVLSFFFLLAIKFITYLFLMIFNIFGFHLPSYFILFSFFLLFIYLFIYF